MIPSTLQSSYKKAPREQRAFQVHDTCGQLARRLQCKQQ